MREFLKTIQEFVSQISFPDWLRILTAFAPSVTRFLTDWFLRNSVRYEKARIETSHGQGVKKLIALGPSPDYVQGLLDDLLMRQKIWIYEGKSPITVLSRTIGWGLSFLGAMIKMTWQNVWEAVSKKEKDREKEN